MASDRRTSVETEGPSYRADRVSDVRAFEHAPEHAARLVHGLYHAPATLLKQRAQCGAVPRVA